MKPKLFITILFTFVILSVAQISVSQTCSFTGQFGGTSSEEGSSIVLDASGNIYSTGFFGGKVDFDPGPDTSYLTSNGGDDIFISKLDANGNFVWAKQIGGTSTDQGNSIAVDVYGNVYTTGRFRLTVDFNPGAGVYNLASTGNDDIFISKLDSNGNFVWAKKIGGTNIDIGNSITTDASGNVYTTGRFVGTVDFNPDNPDTNQVNLTSVGGNDVFISKLDASGNFVWAKLLGGSGSDVGNSIKVDVLGNVYTTGYFSNTADFDPGIGTVNLVSVGSDEIFVSKLDSSGNFIWAKQLGGTSTDIGNSIAVDTSGNVYSTGYFSGTADFDPGTGTYNLTSSGSIDVFISKLDSSGNFIFAKKIGGSSNDEAKSITIDTSGNVYTTGYFTGTADFDPGSGSYNLTANSTDIFISKLDTSGNFIWAKKMGGNGADQGNSIAVDLTGNVFTTGYFTGTADFDPGTGVYNLTSLGGTDVFISKIHPFIIETTIINNLICNGGTNSGSAIVSVTEGYSPFSYLWSSMESTQTAIALPIGNNIVTVTDVFGCSVNDTINITQPFKLALSMGGNNNDYGPSIAVDASGNIYTTGYFQGTADFDPDTSTYNLTATSSDVFVTKTTSSGKLVWAKQLGGTSSDVGNSIAVDALGNVYTIGSFSGTADFDPGTVTYNLTSVGSSDIFISKLNSSGNFVWAKQLGGSGSENGKAIAVDASGNVYTTGFFYGTADFDPGTGVYNLSSSGSSADIFISKLDASGNFVWAKQLGGTSSDVGNSIAVDVSGNVYTTGYFNGTVDFDPGVLTYNLISAGGTDIFISKLNSSGNFIWAKKMGGYGADQGNSIAVDLTGNVFTTGYFNGTADFDPGSGTYNLISTNNDIFISKLNVSGNFVWAKQIGGIGNDYGNSIAVDANGIVNTTGYFNGTADFDPGVGTYNLTSAGGGDIFISKLDNSGNFIWAKIIGGVSEDQANSIAVDNFGNIFTTGFYTGTVDFDPDSGTYNFNSLAGSSDIFISRIPYLSATANVLHNVNCNSTNNGSAIANIIEGYSPFSFNWSDGQTSSIATGLVAGNDTVTVTDVNGCFTSATVTISQTPMLTATTSVTPSACYPPNGTATITSSSGMPPYSYLWSNGQTTQTATGLASDGNYSVIVTDSWGCTIQQWVHIIPLSNPSVYILSHSNVTCYGSCNGSAICNAMGGSPPYTYQWSTLPIQTTANATGLCAGTYTVNVYDSQGCINTSPATITILQPSQLTVNLTPSTATCGNSDGNITTVTTGGIAPYSYQWSNGIVTANINNLNAGTYSVSVSDFYNCITSDSAQVDLFTNSIPVCLVSVDSTSTKNNIIWEKPIVTNISSFNIYREIASTFTFIATVPYASQSVFTDITNGVNPNTTAYKYEITVIDTCGNESELSNYHRTIHVATSPASPCGFNLIWNDYVGFPVTQYLIYRDSSNTGWVKMDSVSFGNTSWTDTTCFTGNDTIAYLVEAIKSDGCFPSKANGQNSTRSNVQRNYSVLVPMVFGNNTNIEIYPNPTNGKLYVHIKGLKSSKTIYSLSIDNALGEIIYKSEIKSEKSFVDLSGKPSGIYIICIKSGEKVYHQKLIKE